jgi:hypothetical protein
MKVTIFKFVSMFIGSYYLNIHIFNMMELEAIVASLLVLLLFGLFFDSEKSSQ